MTPQTVRSTVVLLVLFVVTMMTAGALQVSSSPVEAFGWDNLMPNSTILNRSLLVVVIGGSVINLVMVLITVRRRWRFPRVDEGSGFYPYIRYKISLMALRRALRVETGFLLCQVARMMHTIYSMRDPDPSHALFWAAAEREFVTMMLVYLSVMDLLNRTRISRLQDLLASSPEHEAHRQQHVHPSVPPEVPVVTGKDTEG